MRFGKTEIDAAYVPAALDALARMEQYLIMISAASSDDQVVDIMLMVGSTIQVKIPEDMGLRAYKHLLHHLPPHVLEAAAFEVLRSLTVKVMPLPGEILNTTAVQEWIVVQNHWPRLCQQWRRRLEKISTAKGD